MGWLDRFARRRAPAPAGIRCSPNPNERPAPGEVIWARMPYEDDPRQDGPARECRAHAAGVRRDSARNVRVDAGVARVRQLHPEELG